MNPKCSAARATNEDPFKDLNIEDCSILDTIEERSLCPICKKSRKYFCYTCYVPVEALQGHVPRLKLPIKIDIIKHCREIDGKSTAAHAAVLAPDDVRVYTYPCIPDYDPEEKVIVLYPGKDAVSIKDYFSSYRTNDTCVWSGEPNNKRRLLGSLLPVTRAIFIDSTWNQSRGIYKDERLRALPCVILQSRISQFWRHQNGSPRWYLATVEAMHQFLVELHEAASDMHRSPPVDCTAKDSCDVVSPKGEEVPSGSQGRELIAGLEEPDFSEPYKGQYDNLLFFFRYMYSKIHSLYDHEDLRAYKRPLK